MDGFKRPYRGTKIYVRNKDADQTLVNLYKESEYTKENSVPEDSKTKLKEEDIDDDISAFINDAEDTVETDIPERSEAKKARKKAAKKEKQKSSIKKTIAIIFVAVILIAGVVAGGLWLFSPNTIQNVLGQKENKGTAADEIYYSPLTGLESSNKDAASAAVTCVMIENSTDARPQSGLRAAGVVYEAIAEGGISRFMAVYQDSKPEYLGPIRSARYTFVQFAKPYQCTYIHMGGATNAINELKNGYRDFNAGFYEEKYVSRKISRGRYAPHNVYSRFSWIDQFNYSKGWTTSSFTPFARIQPDTINEVENRDATNITIKLSGDNSYNPGFTYNAATNTYLRYHQRGGAHMDKAEDGTLTQISPNVVIAMKVHVINRAGDVNGYKDHETWGEGDAFVFQDGTVTAGKWRRANISDPLKFYDSNNQEILLNRGQTWVTAYPDNIGTVNWN